MASASFLLMLGTAGFAVAAVASIARQFDRHSRAFTYSVAIGMFVGLTSVGAEILQEKMAPEEKQEESLVVSLLTRR
jgi:hypothetical protein